MKVNGLHLPKRSKVGGREHLFVRRSMNKSHDRWWRLQMHPAVILLCPARRQLSPGGRDRSNNGVLVYIFQS